MIAIGRRVAQQRDRSVGTLKAFARRQDAVAALEFALISPVMIFTLFAAADLSSALSLTRRMTNAADVIAQLVSQQVAPSDEGGSTPTGTITDAELLADFASLLTTLPDVMNDAASQGENWFADIQPIVTSVTFGPAAQAIIPIPGGPAPVVNTATATWSVGPANSGFTQTRACGPLTMAPSNQASPTLTTLPPGVYVPGTATSPGTVIVVDLTYVFRPTFTYWLTGPFTFQRTAYIVPRFFTQLTYGTPSGTGVTSATSGSTTSYTAPGAPSMKSCTWGGTLP